MEQLEENCIARFPRVSFNSKSEHHDTHFPFFFITFIRLKKNWNVHIIQSMEGFKEQTVIPFALIRYKIIFTKPASGASFVIYQLVSNKGLTK